MTNLDRTQAPEIKEFISYRLEAPLRIRSSSSIPLTCFINRQLGLIHITLRIKAGSFYEQKKSTSVFAALLLKESSKTHSSSEVDEFLDFYGASYSASVLAEYIVISLIVPKKNCVTVLPMVFDFLANPVYNDRQVDILCQRQLKNLAYKRQQVGYCASQAMLHYMFGDTGMMGHQLAEEDLRAISVEDLQAYHKQFFCAENIRAFAAGDIDRPIQQFLMDLLSAFPHGEHTVREHTFPQPLPYQRTVLDRHADSLQSSLLICRRSIPYTDTQRHDFKILSTILGGYFGSRLMTNLRETNGYTYGVSCSNFFIHDSSIFYIESEVNVEYTQKAIDECHHELERICSQKVEEKELNQVKSYLQGRHLAKVDNTVSYMTQYMQWDDFGLNQQEWYDFSSAIDNFNADKALLLARQYLKKDGFTSVISGNI